MIPEQTARRLTALVDRQAFKDDALYHAQIAQMRSWLTITQMALEDEDVDPAVAERVLDRLVYGCPSGADAYHRHEANEQIKKILMSLPIKFDGGLPPRGGR